MHHSVHAEKRVKAIAIALVMKEPRGPMEDGGGKTSLQPLMGCTHSLVVEGNGFVDSLLASLLRESAVNIFKNCLASFLRRSAVRILKTIWPFC